MKSQVLNTKILKAPSKKGVALIFFTLIFAVFLGMTMIVLNTGKLIYQKIRLQSAVDLASYAGASVQASYLGNSSSSDQSIQGINNQIKNRYYDLLESVQTHSAPWPFGFPEVSACVAACQAANLIAADAVISDYQSAASDIQDLHDQARRILQQLPRATNQAMEETLALNIRELNLSGQVPEGSLEVTNDVREVMGTDGSSVIYRRKKNAVLGFSSNQGLYLSNVLGAVPHSFPIFGPACFNMNQELAQAPSYYCTVNGIGAPGGRSGFVQASASYARALAGGTTSGNLGRVEEIADLDANALRLHFVENPNKPSPFVVAAAEWYPATGGGVNLENLRNQNDGIFPDRTRLVAVSGAEPFGGSLTSTSVLPYGARLAGIRKLLLNPKLQPHREDYGDLFNYMQFLGPTTADGESLEEADDVIRRFLH